MISLFLFISSAIATETLPLQEIQVGTQTLSVEIADEPHEHALGLMYRKSLPPQSGMLFVYDTAKPRAFWMKNTFIPLSIAYINEKGVIVHLADMTPLSTKSVPSIYPAQYALEVNQGWFEQHNIKKGDVIESLRRGEP